MSKLKRRRSNGRIIKVGKSTSKILSKEAKELIMSGNASKIYDSRGKVLNKYLVVITKKFR
jgi:hypothetical protein